MKRFALALAGVAAMASGLMAQAPAPTRPALLYKEVWKQPPYTGTLNDANRVVTQDAVTV